MIQYALESLLECVSRAVMLAQPTDVLEFLCQYFLHLAEFGKTMPGLDHANRVFRFEEQWEIDFLTHTWNKSIHSAFPSPACCPKRPPHRSMKKTNPVLQEKPEEKVTPRRNFKPKTSQTCEPREFAKAKLNDVPMQENVRKKAKKDPQTSSTAPIKHGVTQSMKKTDLFVQEKPEEKVTRRRTLKPKMKQTGEQTESARAQLNDASREENVQKTAGQDPQTSSVASIKPGQCTGARLKSGKRNYGEGTSQMESAKSTKQCIEKVETVKQEAENRGNRVLWIQRERVKPILGGRVSTQPPGVYVPDIEQPLHLIYYRKQWEPT